MIKRHTNGRYSLTSAAKDLRTFDNARSYVSPVSTGYLHIGGATGRRTVSSWLYARGTCGKFLCDRRHDRSATPRGDEAIQGMASRGLDHDGDVVSTDSKTAPRPCAGCLCVLPKERLISAFASQEKSQRYPRIKPRAKAAGTLYQSAGVWAPEIASRPAP